MSSVVTFPDIKGDAGVFVDGDWVESKDQDADGTVRLIQLADVGSGKFINKSSRFMTMQKAKALKCTFLEPGDILIARMPDPIGRACIFPGLEQPCVTVVDVCVLRIDCSITDRNWLVHFINSNGCHQQISRWVTGTTRQRISRGNLSKVEIPLPPLEEQKRIAAILDKADAIRRKRERAIALTDDLLKSVFLDMFGDPVTNPKGWRVGTIGDCLAGITAGWSAKGEARPAQPHERGVLKISAVTSGNYKATENKFVPDIPASKRLIIPQRGDLLFSRANTRELVAATCIVVDAPNNVFLPDKLWRLDLKQEMANAAYLKFVLSDTEYRALLCTRATGTSGSMLNISKSKLLANELPIPEMAHQELFEATVNKTIEGLPHLEDSANGIQDLTESLTQRAFRGELT